MFTNKIYCFGDGFAHGHIWPEWPQLLEALLPSYKIVTMSGVGAGAEFLVTQFAELLPIDGHVIFQWPSATRFDKIIEDEHWTRAVEQDSVYHFNTCQVGVDTWWLSSASTNKEVQEYHNKYIQPVQALKRLEVYQKLVKSILDNSVHSYMFTSTAEQHSFSLKNSKVQGTEIQPSPLSHYYFLIEKILPGLGLHSINAAKLKDLLIAQKWQPYDPDRAEIWQNIKNQLTNTSDK